MDLDVGSNRLFGVAIPVLWGTRAIVQDKKGRLSAIDLGGPTAKLEILADKPAPGVIYTPRLDGVTILSETQDELYSFSPPAKRFTAAAVLKLPPIEITPNGIRVGTTFFAGNSVSGFGVGIVVDEHGIAMGAPLPAGLARLTLPGGPRRPS